MNKKLCLIYLIIAVCFNLLFFINLKEPVIQTWISYGFINFAFIMMFLSPLFTKNSKSTYLYTVVNTSISFIYFLINLGFGILGIIIKTFSVKFLLTFYIILTSLYLILFICFLITGEKSKSKE